MVAEQFSRKTLVLEDSQKERLTTHLLLDGIEGRFPIFSELIVQRVVKERNFPQPGLRHLRLLTLLAKKLEDPSDQPCLIVAKSSKTERYLTEYEVLKTIGQGRHLFIARYF
jgi:hypothetical protein